MTPDQGVPDVPEREVRFGFEDELRPTWTLFLDSKMAVKFSRSKIMIFAPDGFEVILKPSERIEHLTFRDQKEGFYVLGFRLPKIDHMPAVSAENYSLSFHDEYGNIVVRTESDHMVGRDLVPGMRNRDIGRYLIDMKRRMDQADREEPFI